MKSVCCQGHIAGTICDVTMECCVKAGSRPGDVVYTTGEREGTVQDTTKTLKCVEMGVLASAVGSEQVFVFESASEE